MKNLIKSPGFTVIEMSIALVILGLSLLALAGLMVATTKNNSFGGHMMEATTFAREKLEEIRSASWDSILSGDDQRTGPNGMSFQRNWNVVTDAREGVKTITLNVRWKDKDTHSLQLISMVKSEGRESEERSLKRTVNF